MFVSEPGINEEPVGTQEETMATTEEANIALGVGLSVGLYVLVCVLVPVVAYVGFLWWKYDPFGLMFGGQEYPVSAADGNSRTWRRKTAEPTVSVELGKRGSDYPPVYPMKEQTLPKKKAVEELTESFVYTPPNTSNTNRGSDSATVNDNGPYYGARSESSGFVVIHN